MLSFVFFAVLVSSAAALPFEDCGSVYRLISVDIATCPSAPCLLPLGEIVNISTNFVADSKSVVSLDAYYILNTIQKPVKIQYDPCKANGCSLEQNQAMEYNVTVHVDNSLPSVNGDLVWQLFDEIQRKVICYVVAIRIRCTNADGCISDDVSHP